MKEIIERFDRAYIINLRERSDRRAQTLAEFQKIGIYLPTDKVQFYDAIRPESAENFPSLGFRGSFNSHRNVVRVAKQAGLDNVLVIEDDIGFRNIKKSIVTKLIREIPNEWDVLYFGYLLPPAKNLIGPWVHWTKDTLGGHFYAVNARFFSKLISYMDDCEKRSPGDNRGGPMGRDAVFNHIRYTDPAIKIFLAVPNLAFQRSSRSEITLREDWLGALDKIKSFDPLVSIFRWIKNKLKHV